MEIETACMITHLISLDRLFARVSLDCSCLIAREQCSKTEGIIPALEPSHALYTTMQLAKELGPGKVQTSIETTSKPLTLTAGHEFNLPLSIYPLWSPINNSLAFTSNSIFFIEFDTYKRRDDLSSSVFANI